MKSINEQAPVKSKQSLVINASPERIWQLLTAISEWSQWQQLITRVRTSGPVQAGTVFNWTTGGAAITSTVHTMQPHTSFGWTGKTFGLFAIHNWTLKRQSADSTLVTVEESMEGWLASLFKKTFNKNLAKGMAFWLTALKAAAEKNC